MNSKKAHFCSPMKSLITIFFCIAVKYASVGQEKAPSILMMTGKVLEGKVTSEDSSYIYYEHEKKSGKVKSKKLDWERVFSFTDESGNEKLVYVEDSAIGNFFTEDEMRAYIRGEQDAWNGYKSNWTIWTGIPIAGGVGFLLSSSPLVFVVPFAYMVVASMPKYKMTPGSILNAEDLKNPAYILGYERTARSKRLFKSLASGLAGAAIGVAIGQLTK